MVRTRYGECVRSMSRSQRNRRRRRGRGRPRNKAFLALMVVAVLAALAGLAAVGYVISIAASAPPLDSLKPRDLGSQSEVRAADGTRLGFIQSNELRRPVEGDRIPKTLKDATVAIEDERFYHHKGVDYPGIVRAAVKNLSSHKTVQGGSTITMQLIRNLYISKERTYQRKIREAKLAEELENEQSKSWILDQYLNTVPFGTLGGQTAVGVQAASRVYFGKSVENLKLHEAALLAGLPQAPTTYSPVRAPEKAEARRNEVLAKMADLKMITPADRAARDEARARRQPVALLHRPPRVVLLRLRQGRADQGVRRQDRAQGRAARRHHDRPQEAAGRARRDQRPPGRHRAVVGDRHDRPQERLHQGDGVVVGLRQVEVQPRRPGPPPARLDVQDHGADDGAAEGRRPAVDELRLEAAEVQRPAVGADRVQTYAARLPRLDQPRAGDAVLGQHRLHAARARPRAARGQADRLRHGHQDAPRRLPGGVARRPHASASRRWRWPTRSRRSPPAATATARPRSRRSPSPTASPSCRGASRSSARRRSRTA